LSVIRQVQNDLSQTVKGIFGGILFIAVLYGGLYLHQHQWERWEGEFPVIQELTNTYQLGLQTLGNFPLQKIQQFYTLESSVPTFSEIQFEDNNSEGLTPKGELIVNSTWHRSDVREKLLQAGFQKGKLRKAEKILDYVERYKRTAMWDMYQSGVPASIKLAQAILESGAGNSKLARRSNNHFGIKALPSKRGRAKIQAQKFDDLRDEDFVPKFPAIGVYNTWDDHPYDRFEKYQSVSDSYQRHTQLLTRPCTTGKIGCYNWIWQTFPVGKNHDITAAAQKYYPSSKILAPNFFDGQTDLPYYAACAAALKMAGYATSKTYHKKIAFLVETYELWRFDLDLVRAVGNN